MNKTYELTTIVDIFEKVPSDRIPACMEELAVGLTAAKKLVEDSGLPPEAVTMAPIQKWVDDGKEVIGVAIHNRDTGEEVGRVRVK